MLYPFTTLTANSGERHMLVPAREVRRWDAQSAYATLLAALHDAHGAVHLRNLARASGCTHDDAESVARHLAGEVASGRLMPVCVPQPHQPGMRPAFRRDERAVDWANAVPLSDLREREPTVEFGWVSIELVDSRGVAYSDFEVTLVHGDGRRDRVQLDAAGRHTARAIVLPGPSRVLLPPRMERPASQPSGPGTLEMDGFRKLPGDIEVPREPKDPISLRPLNRHHRLVVHARPKVTEIPIDGWAQGSKVMRWGGMRPRVDGSVGTARAALRLGLWLGRGRAMCVAGHADALGQDTDNDALSAARATSVQLFAAGRLDEWADHAAAHGSDLDLRCALVACHTILGLGGAALDDPRALETAHRAVRERAGLAAEGPVVVEDWRAVADVYDEDLAGMLSTDRAGLAETRATVRWTTPASIGLGERHPRPAAELADIVGLPALPQRRGSLLVFDDANDGEPAVHQGGAEIYDGTFLRDVLVVPGEVLVEVRVGTPTDHPIARGRAWISVGDLGASERIADANGVIRFMALDGERIAVLAAFDADGHGTMVSSGAGTNEPVG